MKSKILLVEDEIDLGNVVKQYLEVMDFVVDWSINGKDALEKCKANPGYQLLLIDVSIPGIDGFELASQLLNHSISVPFIFLTAKNERKDKLHGLKLGADDYITKPFDIDELVLRMRNILKRSHTIAVTSGYIEIGNLRLYRDMHQLLIDRKKVVTLSAREAQLLEYLFENPNRVIKREDILTQFWGENDYFHGRSLDVFISRLRKHISNNDRVSISNIYGVGFVFNVKS